MAPHMAAVVLRPIVIQVMLVMEVMQALALGLRYLLYYLYSC